MSPAVIRELLELSVGRVINDWLEGRTTGSTASEAFCSMLAQYRPDPAVAGEVLRSMRGRAPGLVRGLLDLLPSEHRDAQPAEVPTTEQEQAVERVVLMPEDDALLPVIRAFDDALYPTEALQKAHEYFDGLWQAGMSPANLSTLVDRLKPVVLGPDRFSGEQAAELVRHSLGKRLNKAFRP